MGRAIDMEKDIDVLKLKIEKLENVVRGMTHTLEEIEDEIYEVEENSTKTGEKDAKKEKANNEGNGKRSVKSNKRNADDEKVTAKS